MKNIYKNILIAGLAGMVVSCGGSDGLGQGGDFIHVSDLVCPKATYSAEATGAENLIINSQEELSRAWSRLNYAGSATLPTVDFENGSVIFIYGGSRPTTNEWITVAAVQNLPDQPPLVTINNFTSSHVGCGGDAAVSYPFCFVQIDAHIESAEFKEEELNACESMDTPDLY